LQVIIGMKHRTSDPYCEFNFVVELGDIGDTIAGFQDLSGLSADGKMVAVSSHSTVKIVLKRGRMRTDWFQAWREAIKKRHILPHGVTIVFRNEQCARMNIQSAWPTKIEGPAIKAASNNVEVETIELKGEGVSFSSNGSDD
jgi:phage tail-like protein